MARVQQYYGDARVPMAPSTPSDVVSAWQTHRARLRGWLGGLPAPAWTGPTRCAGWDVTALVRHLISGSQFLGFTLHEAVKGQPTRLLQGFDPQATPAGAAALIPELAPAELLALLRSMDDNVDRECTLLERAGWDRCAEAPLGTVPAHLSVNHFLFDSWVHEHDLMLPLGETPFLDQAEAAAVLPYVLALAGMARVADASSSSPVTIDVTAADLALDVRLTVLDGRATASIGAHGENDGRVRGRALDLVDVATGRAPDEAVEGDDAALGLLLGFAAALA